MHFYETLTLAENTPTLETNRLILRRFTPEDAPALLPLLADREVNTFLPWFPLETLSAVEEHLRERYLESYRLPSAYRYAVCLKADNVPIGYAGVSDGDSHDLGYGLRREYWRQGIITEACGAVVRRLAEAGFLYVTATHDVRNPHSGGVMKNIGMTYRYTYEELCQPKNELVRFRMYQRDFGEGQREAYWEYWDKYPHFLEETL